MHFLRVYAPAEPITTIIIMSGGSPLVPHCLSRLFLAISLIDTLNSGTTLEVGSMETGW